MVWISLCQQQFASFLTASENVFAKIFLVADTPFYVLALITTVFSLLMYFNAFYRHGYLKVNTENVKGANLDLRTKKKDKQKKEK